MNKFKLLFMMAVCVGVLLGYQNCAIVADSRIHPAGAPSSGTISFSSEAERLSAKANFILTTKCQSCHNSSLKSGDFNVSDLNEMFYNRHVVPGEPLLSGLYSAVANGDMPPAPQPQLSTQEIQDIYNWIQDGFKNLPSTTIGGGGVQPTFASLSANIFQTKCIGCHGNGTALGGISFATFNSTRSTVNVGDAASSALYISVTTGRRGGRMPQGGGALSNAELSAIQTWIQQGAMNN